jgi:hypothetical protein
VSRSDRDETTGPRPLAERSGRFGRALRWMVWTLIAAALWLGAVAIARYAWDLVASL